MKKQTVEYNGRVFEVELAHVRQDDLDAVIPSIPPQAGSSARIRRTSGNTGK